MPRDLRPTGCSTAQRRCAGGHGPWGLGITAGAAAAWVLVSGSGAARAAEPAQATAPAAPAASAVHVTAALGANWPSTRSNSGDLGVFHEDSFAGLAAEIGVGYSLGAARLELTYAQDNSRLRSYESVSDNQYHYTDGGQTARRSAFLTAYWDLLPQQRFSPYVGAGLGYSHLRVEAFSDEDLSYRSYGRSLLGYQLKAGAAWRADAHATVFVEAVYRGTSGYHTDDGYDSWNTSSFPTWGAQAGVRWRL